MDETHEIGFVNGGVCSNKSVRNNSNGKNSSQRKQLEFSKSCSELSSRNSPLSSNIQNIDADKNADPQAGSFSVAQKPGARDQQWRCEGFVDESCVDDTHELGNVKGGVCFNKSGKNNPNGGNYRQEKRLDFSKSCGDLSSRISRLSKLF